MKYLIFVLLFLAGKFWASEEMKTLDFLHLKDLNFTEEHSIQIRGFLHADLEGQWILADEPRLKSCCLGAKDKRFHQIYLDTSFDSHLKNTIMTVQGRLKWGPNDRFHLRETLPLLENNKHPRIIVWTIVGLMLGGSLYLFYKMNRT